MMVLIKEETIIRTIILMPIEFLGLQSFFSSLFGYSHNGGTWFISCILFCYLAYPFLQEGIKAMGKKGRIRLMAFCMIILLYAPIVVHVFSLKSIYSNPFFRCLEFIIGIVLAAIKMDYPKEKMRIIYNWWTIILVFIIMIVAVTIGVNHNMAVGNYMLYSWICLPCFMIILLGLSGVDSRATSRSKVLRWLSGIMYVFFLAQLFSNRISKRIIEAGNITSNMLKIIIGWAACIIIALTLRIIEINLNSFLNNLFLKNDVNSQT